MARFIPGPLVSVISGRVGQSIFTSYKGVGVVKQAPTSFYNPNSSAQQSARAATSYIAQQWTTLTDQEQGTWRDDAEAEYKRRARDSALPKCVGSIFKGYRGPFSAFNMFVTRNFARWSAGLKPLTDILRMAPLGLARPEGFRSVSAIVGPNFIEFSWTLITNLPKTDRFKLWIRSIDARVHVQLAATSPCHPEGTITITSVRGISGIPISIPPGRYELQAQIVNESGLESVDSERIEIRMMPDNFKLVYMVPRTLIYTNIGTPSIIPWTTPPLAPFVPPGANGILIQAELLKSGGVLANNSLLEIRRDSTQGVGLSVRTLPTAVPTQIHSDNGIIPITQALTFDLQLTGPVGPETYDINIYMLAYIH